MTLPIPLPYGIRDLKVTGYTTDAATALKPSSVDVPLIRSLSFTETEDFEELRGDDELAATHGNGPIVEWETESGGMSMDAYAEVMGGTSVLTGVTPNLKRTYKKNKSQTRPYFKVEGQAISDSGGDFHTIIWRARVTSSAEGEFSDGSFFLPSLSGQGLGSLVPGSVGDLYDFVQNETAVAIP